MLCLLFSLGTSGTGCHVSLGNWCELNSSCHWYGIWAFNLQGGVHWQKFWRKLIKFAIAFPLHVGPSLQSCSLLGGKNKADFFCCHSTKSLDLGRFVILPVVTFPLSLLSLVQWAGYGSAPSSCTRSWCRLREANFWNLSAWYVVSFWLPDNLASSINSVIFSSICSTLPIECFTAD